MTIDKERIQAVLDRVRPFLQADGGDIELIAVEGRSAFFSARRASPREQ